MLCDIKTRIGGTLTTDGYIHHKPGPGGILMPVALKVQKQRGVKGMLTPQPPLKDGRGNYVFVLPGGNVYNG